MSGKPRPVLFHFDDAGNFGSVSAFALYAATAAAWYGGIGNTSEKPLNVQRHPERLGCISMQLDQCHHLSRDADELHTDVVLLRSLTTTTS